LPASTSITPVRYADSIMATLATVKASPARRHQVRAHCAYKGFPLVGDSLYGAKTNLQNFFPEISAQFFLFAHFLRFRHPTSGTEMNFLLDLPPAIKNIF
jgi:23S rRNA pseudouridine1911/1915/1917 synthase